MNDFAGSFIPIAQVTAMYAPGWLRAQGVRCEVARAGQFKSGRPRYFWSVFGANGKLLRSHDCVEVLSPAGVASFMVGVRAHPHHYNIALPETSAERRQ